MSGASRWANTTPEERKRIAAKSVATRATNKAKRLKDEESARLRAIELKHNIRTLQEILERLQSRRTMELVSAAISGESLLSQDDICKSAIPWEKACGVYFLVKNDLVVYVGQSVNVHARIAQHVGQKDFDKYAFVQCSPDALDKVESLYIHFLRPSLNASCVDSSKMAPLKLKDLIGLTA